MGGYVSIRGIRVCADGECRLGSWDGLVGKGYGERNSFFIKVNMSRNIDPWSERALTDIAF